MHESGKTGEAPSGAAACPVAMPPAPPGARAWRMLPLAVFAAFVVVAYAKGWLGLLTLENIVAVHERWHALLEQHRSLAVVAFTGIYVAVGALCVPGGALLTAAGGLAFGTLVGGTATVVGATIGACLLFLIARSACGEWLLRTEEPWLRKLRDGFEKSALSYLLFLRLVPVFPFWLVNVAAAVLGLPLRTFVIGTFFGIIPATFAYASAGAGLGHVIAKSKADYEACLAAAQSGACKLVIPAGALFTRELALALVLLGVLALIPVFLKKWRRSDVGAQ